jgi:hypothetical protein
MKKHIILAVVVVAALVVAGTSGVFATWSDSEVSFGNEIITGSVDLKVNGFDDEPYGAGVPAKVFIDCMIPCNWNGPYEVELWNAGICEWPSSAYIHFKDACCFNAPPKEGSGYFCPETDDLKPEPELVAEFGGKVDCTVVPGIGITGDDCSMLSHILVEIWDEDGNIVVQETRLVDILCDEIYLGELNPCEPRMFYMWFRLVQDSEDTFFPDGGFFLHPDEIGLTPGTPEYHEAWMHWVKFNDWPSYAVMRDGVTFNMEFDLLLWESVHEDQWYSIPA